MKHGRSSRHVPGSESSGLESSAVGSSHPRRRRGRSRITSRRGDAGARRHLPGRRRRGPPAVRSPVVRNGGSLVERDQARRCGRYRESRSEKTSSWPLAAYHGDHSREVTCTHRSGSGSRIRNRRTTCSLRSPSSCSSSGFSVSLETPRWEDSSTSFWSWRSSWSWSG